MVSIPKHLKALEIEKRAARIRSQWSAAGAGSSHRASAGRAGKIARIHPGSPPTAVVRCEPRKARSTGQ